MSSLSSEVASSPSFWCQSFKIKLSESDLALLNLFFSGQYNNIINKLVFGEIRFLLRETWGDAEFAFNVLFKKFAMLVDVVDLLGGDDMFPTQKEYLTWRSKSNESDVQVTGTMTEETLASMEEVLKIWWDKLSENGKFIHIVSNTMRDILYDGMYLANAKKFQNVKDLGKVCEELNMKVASLEGGIRTLESDCRKVNFDLKITKRLLVAANDNCRHMAARKDMMEEELREEREVTQRQVRETRQRLDREIQRRLTDAEFWR